MRTEQQWFDEYAVSHQNETNQLIHYICVPAIVFSLVGILMSIPSTFLSNLLGLNNPFIENWATIVLIFALIFYMRISFSLFLKMLVFAVLCVVLNYYLGQYLPLFYTSVAIFVAAWIAQFYGHKVEGKKPSFLKDMQFLLIGPLWIIKKMTSK
jgi:uncharacterized membrane protein YGL010W